MLVAELVEPDPTRPNEGRLHFQVEWYVVCNLVCRHLVSELYWAILCQINKEFWVTSWILMKLGVFVIPMVLTTHTNF